MGDRVFGLSAAQTMFEAMGEDAKAEVGELLADIAIEALSVQLERVPAATGALASGLAADTQIEQLRARVGLLNLKSGRSDLFYGRPVDHGVKAQTVLVQRRRRVNGRLRTQSRGSRKRASDIVSTYALHVKARPGVEFIEAPDLGRIADGKIDAFWDRLEAAGGAT